MQTKQKARKPRAKLPARLAFTALVGVGLGVLARRARANRGLDLQGKVVLITGSSHGLGLTLAETFAERGARLVLCARHAEPLEEARRLVAALGVDVLAIPCDVTDQSLVQQMVDTALAHFGQIDVLVNNAATLMIGPITALDMQDFADVLDVTYWGAVYSTMAVLPDMLARHSGHIVNIASLGGRIGLPHLLPHCSAKGALTGFSEGLSAELAQEGIQVTTVTPGLMRTGLHATAVFRGHRQEDYTWFNKATASPFTSISADRAAREIVKATELGYKAITLPPQAQALSWLHGLAPGVALDLLGLVNRYLPGGKRGNAGQETVRQPEMPAIDLSLNHAEIQAVERHPPRSSSY